MTPACLETQLSTYASTVGHGLRKHPQAGTKRPGRAETAEKNNQGGRRATQEAKDREGFKKAVLKSRGWEQMGVEDHAQLWLGND